MKKKWKHCKTNIIYQSTSHDEACVECISPRCSICVCVCVCVIVYVFVFECVVMWKCLFVTKKCAFLLRDY